MLPQYELPLSFEGRAEALCKALRLSESSDSRKREFSIFGGAGVLLWVNEKMNRMTHDVDIYGDLPEGVELEFQYSPIENYFIAPEWKEDRVEATNALGLKHWRVWLVHPVDIITLKLGRWEDRDFEDALLLVDVFDIGAETVLSRLTRAWKYYATDHASQRSKIALGFEDLFCEPLPDDVMKVLSVEDYLL